MTEEVNSTVTWVRSLDIETETPTDGVVVGMLITFLTDRFNKCYTVVHTF